MHYRPPVLCVSGLDPSGGAGIQADIETLGALGCRACPVISCLTVQNTSNVMSKQPVDPVFMSEQLEVLLEDIPITYMKLGLLGSSAVIESLCNFLDKHTQIKVILDPVLAAGGGKSLTNSDQRSFILEHLLPHIALITPNAQEALGLVPNVNIIEDAVTALTERGCQHTLVTDIEPEQDTVTHQLWSEGRLAETFTCRRLPHTYHGSGCTLATAITAHLARGFSMTESVSKAQTFTWQSLNHASLIGKGQHLPNRYFWANPYYDNHAGTNQLRAPTNTEATS